MFRNCLKAELGKLLAGNKAKTKQPSQSTVNTFPSFTSLASGVRESLKHLILFLDSQGQIAAAFAIVMRHWVVAGLCLGVAGCTMAASIPIGSPSGLGCSTAAGGYYLSKTHLQVVVERWGRGPGTAASGSKSAQLTNPSRPRLTWYKLKEVGFTRVADRRHGYCLDYIASPTTDEKVVVLKDRGTQLLSQISTQAIDQSRYILTTLINAIFTGIAGIEGADFRASPPAGEVDAPIGVAFNGEYDPFDVEQSAIVNNALSALGFCLVLEGHTFDLSRDTIDAYCSDPSRALAGRNVPRRGPDDIEKTNGPGPDIFRQPAMRGVLYRPRVPYNYYLFVRHLEQGRVRWKLRQTATVALENRSPIISIGVDRSFFASRRTALVFDSGVLKNVCIYKTSELEEIVKVPLAIAENLTDLPGNILQLRLENTNNFKRLVDVQERLIKAQADHVKVIRKQGEAQQFEQLTEEQKGREAASPTVYSDKDARGTRVGVLKATENGAEFPSWDAVCGGAFPGQPDVNEVVSPTSPQSTIFQKGKLAE